MVKDKKTKKRAVRSNTVVVEQDPRIKYMEDHPEISEKYAGQCVAFGVKNGVVSVLGAGPGYKEARAQVDAQGLLSEAMFTSIPETPAMMRANYAKQQADKHALEDRLAAVNELDAVLATWLCSEGPGGGFGDSELPNKVRALRDLLVVLKFDKCLQQLGITNPLKIWDRNYDQDAKCARKGCGHAYERHFDWGNGYYPHCKYDECDTFVPEGVDAAPLEEHPVFVTSLERGNHTLGGFEDDDHYNSDDE